MAEQCQHPEEIITSESLVMLSSIDDDLAKSKLHTIELMILDEFKLKYLINKNTEICYACKLMIRLLYKKVYEV